MVEALWIFGFPVFQFLHGAFRHLTSANSRGKAHLILLRRKTTLRCVKDGIFAAK